jgi:hypothetical protein
MKWGSTSMRAHQLAEMVSPHLPDVEINLTPFSRHWILQQAWARLATPGTTFIATKGVVGKLYSDTVEILHRRDCRICLDIVDIRRDQWPGPELNVDCFISPSRAGTARLQAHVNTAYASHAQRPVVLPIYHNADIRLYNAPSRPQETARIAYWGDRRNAVNSPKIEAQVDFHEGADAQGFKSSLEIMRNYNVHFAVRPTDPEEWRIKPFTKGVNAAVMGACVLVDKGVPDAVDFLGTDYPFMLSSNSENDVLTGISMVKEAFGGPEWHMALDRCRHLAEQVSPVALSNQTRDILKAVWS